MKIHDLKTHPEYFRKVRLGLKTSEIRLDDRDFMIGDRLQLCEFGKRKGFTGKRLIREISDITRLYQIIPGNYDARWVVLHMFNPTPNKGN